MKNNLIPILALILVFSFVSCEEEAVVTISPTVSTGEALNILSESADLSGNVLTEGSSSIISMGVEYSAISSFEEGAGTMIPSALNDTGIFVVSVSGLSSEVVYYYRSYATNSEATSYGLTKSFITLFDNVGPTDIDNNYYGAVQIGDQIWMSENLKVTKYPNGDAIPNITDNTAWENLADDNTSYAYCYYDNDINSKYGVLYTYATALKACPTGWHLPSSDEWTILASYLTDNGHSGSEGNALKTTTGWYKGGNGIDNYNFNALPTGFRNTGNGKFYYATAGCYWWSSTEESSSSAYDRSLYHSLSNFGQGDLGKASGISVRCLRD